MTAPVTGARPVEVPAVVVAEELAAETGVGKGCWW